MIVTPLPGVLTFPILQRLCGPGLVVSDEEVQRAMALAHEHLRRCLSASVSPFDNWSLTPIIMGNWHWTAIATGACSLLGLWVAARIQIG